MSETTEMIKAHHRSISRQLEQGVDAIVVTEADSFEERKDSFSAFVEFLTDDLMPHAEGEERSMYPAVRDLVCRYDNPLATMSLDHQAIIQRIDRLKETVSMLNGASPQDRAALLPEAKRLAIELGALVSVHLAKEEIALLPLMDEHMAEDELQAVVSGMHGEE